MQDHYAVLEIGRDASAEDVQRAYRALALRYHPDRNAAPDAAARMAAINEAYEVLRDRGRRRSYDQGCAKPNPNTELTSVILNAARDVILRVGWTVVQDSGSTLLLAKGKQQVRVLFLEQLIDETLRRLSRQYGPDEPMVILAVSIEGPIHVGSKIAAIDLMRGDRHGVRFHDDPDGLFKPLLAAFL